jgi:hypothetical protein
MAMSALGVGCIKTQRRAIATEQTFRQPGRSKIRKQPSNNSFIFDSTNQRGEYGPASTAGQYSDCPTALRP